MISSISWSPKGGIANFMPLVMAEPLGQEEIDQNLATMLRSVKNSSAAPANLKTASSLRSCLKKPRTPKSSKRVTWKDRVRPVKSTIHQDKLAIRNNVNSMTVKRSKSSSGLVTLHILAEPLGHEEIDQNLATMLRSVKNSSAAPANLKTASSLRGCLKNQVRPVKSTIHPDKLAIRNNVDSITVKRSKSSSRLVTLHILRKG